MRGFTWMSGGRWTSAVFAAHGGLLAMWSAGYFVLPVIATAIGAASAAAFSIGLTLGWKALDAFSVALREAQSLPKNERTAFRRESRVRRAQIALAIALQTILCAISGACVIALRDVTIQSFATPRLLYSAGAGIGLATMVLFGLFRQYFGGDDLIAQVRDRVDEQRTRSEEIAAIAAAGEIAEHAKQQLAPRRVIAR